MKHNQNLYRLINKIDRYTTFESIRPLLAPITDINERYPATEGGNTALIKAARKGNIRILQFLIEYMEADINTPDGKGNTALMIAAKHHNSECVDILLEHNANVNAQNEQGETALTFVVRSLFPEIIRALLEKHATITEEEKAAIAENIVDEPEIFTMLGLEEKSIEDSSSSEDEREDIDNNEPSQTFIESIPQNLNPPLIKAATRKDTEALEFLLKDRKVDVNITDSDGNTALIIALKNNNPQSVKILLEHNPNIDAENNKGETAFRVIINLLNEAKSNATINTQDKNILRCAQIFLKNNPNLCATNDQGETSLDIVTDLLNSLEKQNAELWLSIMTASLVELLSLDNKDDLAQKEDVSKIAKQQNLDLNSDNNEQPYPLREASSQENSDDELELEPTKATDLLKGEPNSLSRATF